MNKKVINIKLLVILLLLPFLSSCIAHSYSPRLALKPTMKKMGLVVSVENFENKRPIEDTKGESVTADESFDGDLGVIVTKEVMSELLRNGYFENVAFNADNPDLIMKGEIRHFKGQLKPTAGFYVGLFIYVPWIIGLPTFSLNYDIELVIMLYDKDNNFIKEYTSRVEDKQRMNMYKSINLFSRGNPLKSRLISETDKRFAVVVSTIMTEIVADLDFINEKIKK